MIDADIDLRREFVAGDLGWVVASHGEIYAREHGWSPSFEAKVAAELGRAVQHWNPERSAMRMAAAGGRRLGSVFVVPREPDVAQLRFFIVDPAARGLGVGRRLLSEAIGFARASGYLSMVLFTFSDLTVARHLYARAGFILTVREPLHAHGQDLVEETWTLQWR